MEKVKYIDGLRGLASIIVVLSHFVVFFYPSLYTGDPGEARFVSKLDIVIAGTPLNLIYNGNFAVCIFFLLSGYVLSYKFFKTNDYEHVISGAFRRYFRLLIPVLAVNIVTFVLMKENLFFNRQVGDIIGSHWWLNQQWSFNPTISNLLRESFLGVFFLQADNYNPAQWTMTYELLGSFLVFAILALFGRYKNRNFVYFILCCVFFQSYFLAFLAGLIICDLSINGFIEAFGKKAFKWVLIGLIFGSYPAGMDVSNTIYRLFDFSAVYDAPIIYNMPLFYHILGSVCFFLVLINSERLQRFFSAKPLVLLGRMSFSVYLIHLPIMGTFSAFIFTALRRNTSDTAAFAVTFVSSAALILIVSFIMNKFVDETGVRLTQMLYNLFNDKLLKRLMRLKPPRIISGTPK